MAYGNLSGTETFTADGAVIDSGAKVRIFNVTWVSGATAGILQLFNGTSATGTPYFSEAGTANQSKTVNFENGMVFANGCYVDINANCSLAILQCRAEF